MTCLLFLLCLFPYLKKKTDSAKGVALRLIHDFHIDFTHEDCQVEHVIIVLYVNPILTDFFFQASALLQYRTLAADFCLILIANVVATT